MGQSTWEIRIWSHNIHIVADTNISMMRSSLCLVLFSLVLLLALTVAEEQQGEELAESRQLRQAGLAQPERKRKKIQKRRFKKGSKKAGKKGSKKQKNKPMKKGRRKQKKGASKRRRGGNKGQNNKGQKGGQRRNNRPQARREGRSTVAGTCFESAIFYMKLWKDVVGNFEKQRKRMIKQNKTGGNKSGKKGAAQLQNLTKTLFDCEKSVNASCNPSNFPQPNFTFINTCKELVDNFTKVATTCLGKSVGGSKTNNTDACTCWSGEMLNITSQTLKNCKANKESSAITSALKACTTAFGKCRKFEDAASTAIMSCASDSSKLTKKAANLAANNASMTAAKEKMASLASSRYHSGRKSRATATSCSEIITISTTIVKIVEQNPQSTKISTYAKKISSATVTCTAAEKTSMAAQVTSMETAIVSVSVVLTAIQEQIETLTGSTASATQLDAAASGETSTAAPVGSVTSSVTTSMPASRTFTYPSSSITQGAGTTTAGAAATTASGAGKTTASFVTSCTFSRELKDGLS